METGHHHEPTEGWREIGVGREEWERLEHLLDIVRREHKRMELSPERVAEIRERVMERLERNERRRRRWRALVAGAGVVLAAVVVVTAVRRARRLG